MKKYLILVLAALLCGVVSRAETYCEPSDPVPAASTSFYGVRMESLDKYNLEIKVVRPGYKPVVIPFDFKSVVDNPMITIDVKLKSIEE